MEPTLSEVEALARAAGEILKAGFGKNIQVDLKGTIDVVTEVDHRSERFLMAEILERYPDHGIIAEESGGQSGRTDALWYIDPLDGTVNYAHALPLFSVSIAYGRAGQIELGVIYDPMHDECFSAARGQGSRLNGQPVTVSSVSQLDQSLLVTGFPYDIRTNPDNNLDHYARFSVRTQGVRRLGSAALDMGYVAAGRLDGFWELRLNAWDVAAGALIVQEAGGIVTNLGGGSNFLQPPFSLLAANPHLHPQMLAILHEE